MPPSHTIDRRHVVALHRQGCLSDSSAVTGLRGQHLSLSLQIVKVTVCKIQDAECRLGAKKTIRQAARSMDLVKE